mmetsp:Transcript_14157/g.26782  ORF Transcript_14157/g.26782 Transcript_14157/m.26782 type:complete len:87 (+) Transcript_14157:1709-1969(+)
MYAAKYVKPTNGQSQLISYSKMAMMTQKEAELEHVEGTVNCQNITAMSQAVIVKHMPTVGVCRQMMIKQQRKGESPRLNRARMCKI